MKDIEVDYTIGNETKQLKITFTSQGTGQIMMDKYYHGQVVFRQNQWRVFLADKSELNNSDDLQNLVQILNKQKQS
jgi:hypothetical protein